MDREKPAFELFQLTGLDRVAALTLHLGNITRFAGCGQPYGRVTAQSKLLFFSVGTVLVEPALGAAGADLQVQPASIGEARLLAIRWADGVAAVGIGQHGVQPSWVGVQIPALGPRVGVQRMGRQAAWLLGLG